MTIRQATNGCATGAIVALALAWGAAIHAATLRMPDGRQIVRGADSPGQVVFNHSSHVDADKPACTGCHPREFRILKATRRAPIRHAEMEKGNQCGVCHNGTRAFAMDDCTLCHAS